MNYFLFFLISLTLSIIFTQIVKQIASRANIVDSPDLGKKKHKGKIPLLGGIAIFLSFFIVLLLIKEKLVIGDLNYSHWLGFFVGALFLMIGGFLDDKFNLSAKKQIIFPILAIICLIAGGVNIEKITNPFGGFIYFNEFFSFFLIAVWLFLMMYTTKLLDGVDGLVSGLGAIGGLIIFLFTATTKYFQPDIALTTAIFVGSCLGFLIFNWHPARIFLGEGGSLLIGYVLGVLAIISGGKIAIALLILGIPMLDVFWTVVRRTLKGKNPFIFADREHLHHRLLRLGLSQPKTVLIFYALAFLFGTSGLFLQTFGKILAVFILIMIMLVFVISFTYLDNRKNGL